MSAESAKLSRKGVGVLRRLLPQGALRKIADDPDVIEFVAFAEECARESPSDAKAQAYVAGLAWLLGAPGPGPRGAEVVRDLKTKAKPAKRSRKGGRK